MGKPRRKKARKDGAALDEDEREHMDRMRMEAMRGAQVSSQTGAGMKINGLKACAFNRFFCMQCGCALTDVFLWYVAPSPSSLPLPA